MRLITKLRNPVFAKTLPCLAIARILTVFAVSLLEVMVSLLKVTVSLLEDKRAWQAT